MRTDWDKLRETKLRPEINKIIEKPSISEKDVCDLKMLLSSMEKSFTIQMFEDEGYGDSYEYRNTYSRGRRSRGYYDYHPNNNRNYYDGYSGHDEKEDFRMQLQEMMRSSQNPEMRHVIQEAMDKIR